MSSVLVTISMQPSYSRLGAISYARLHDVLLCITSSSSIRSDERVNKIHRSRKEGYPTNQKIRLRELLRHVAIQTVSKCMSARAPDYFEKVSDAKPQKSKLKYPASFEIPTSGGLLSSGPFWHGTIRSLGTSGGVAGKTLVEFMCVRGALTGCKGRGTRRSVSSRHFCMGGSFSASYFDHGHSMATETIDE
jgi:hypothetical protein